MAQLKLMKKEWFNWFDKTFLDNITAWTEYYYINPDTQHWISNNFVDLADRTLSNSGVTAVIKDGVITLNGTATVGGGFYNLYRGVSDDCGYGCFHYGSLTDGNVNMTAKTSGPTYNSWSNTSHTKNDFIREINTSIQNGPYELSIVFRNGTTFNNYQLRPMVWKNGKTAPSAFNPHLIKIEDILEVVDLSELTWFAPNASGWTQSTYISTLRGYGTSEMPKIFCDKLTTRTPDEAYANDYSISAAGVAPNSRITIRMPELIGKDQDEIKQILKGYYAVFVKANSPY